MTEIVGAFFYVTTGLFGRQENVSALFVDEDSCMTASFAMICEYHERADDIRFTRIVTQTFNGRNETLLWNDSYAGELPRDGGEAALPLYAGCTADQIAKARSRATL